MLDVAEPHQSTVAAILSAAQQGLFTVAEAELMIDRVRRLSIKGSHTLEQS
jgi:hypothetical protein